MCVWATRICVHVGPCDIHSKITTTMRMKVVTLMATPTRKPPAPRKSLLRPPRWYLWVKWGSGVHSGFRSPGSIDAAYACACACEVCSAGSDGCGLPCHLVGGRLCSTRGGVQVQDVHSHTVCILAKVWVFAGVWAWVCLMGDMCVCFLLLCDAGGVQHSAQSHHGTVRGGRTHARRKELPQGYGH
jgi:hypothetical protein